MIKSVEEQLNEKLAEVDEKLARLDAALLLTNEMFGQSSGLFFSLYYKLREITGKEDPNLYENIQEYSKRREDFKPLLPAVAESKD